MKIAYKELGKWGRLGNQLWEIAATFGVAAQLGVDFENVEFNRWDYEPYFNVPSLHFKDNPEGEDSFKWAERLPASERPYMQDHKLVWSVEPYIQQYFMPSLGVQMRLFREYEWFYNIPNKVAVHIRRDERVTQFAHTHPTPPSEYYTTAMDLERERLGDPTFCIFSDDIEWCRSAFGKKFVYVEGYPRHQDSYLSADEPVWSDHLDLFLMNSCDGHIIANSTFSWWGAFLSSNISPIHPAVWYGPALSHIDWTLQIPPMWRKVGW